MITVELSNREAKALHNVASLVADSFIEAGADIHCDDFPDEEREHGCSPLLSALMQLELALALAGADS